MSSDQLWPVSELGKEAINASRPFSFKEHPEVIFVNTGDVLAGKFLHSNFSPGKGLPGQAKKALRRNDILLTEIRPGNGRFAYVTFEPHKHVVSTKFMVIESRGRVLPRFLYHVLTNQASLDEFQRIAESRSGTFPQITFDSIAHFPVPLPPADEQHRLVHFLDGIEARLDLLRETNATLEAIAQALFKSWFVDFDPVHARARGEQPEGLPEPLAALFPDSFEESPLDLVPRGWRVGVLGEIVTIKGGKQLDKGSFDDHGANPVFGGAGVMGRTDLKNATGFVITVGRVGAYCGQFFWHLGDAWVNNNSSHIQPASTEQSVWIYQWLRAANIDHIKRGAAQPFVSNGDLAELNMVIPDDGVVNHFVEVASPIYDRMHSLQAQAQTLATLRDTLLPRLISGQLRLPEAQANEETAA